MSIDAAVRLIAAATCALAFMSMPVIPAPASAANAVAEKARA